MEKLLHEFHIVAMIFIPVVPELSLAITLDLNGDWYVRFKRSNWWTEWSNGKVGDFADLGGAFDRKSGGEVSLESILRR
jgi:hypothetical protein